MTRVIILLLLLAPCGLPCQGTYGFKVNLGASRIPAIFEMSPTWYEWTDQHLARLSGEVRLFYNVCLYGNFTVGTELLVSEAAGRQIYWSELFDGVSIVGSSTDITDRWIASIAVPVYFGYTVGEKWNFNFGAELRYVIVTRGHEHGNAIANGVEYEWDNDAAKLNINTYDLGLRPGLIYHYTDWIQFEANGYYGLTNIVHDAILRDHAVWKVQQLTVGIRFNFHNPVGATAHL